MKNRLFDVSKSTHLICQRQLKAFQIDKMERNSLVDELTPILLRETIMSRVCLEGVLYEQ